MAAIVGVGKWYNFIINSRKLATKGPTWKINIPRFEKQAFYNFYFNWGFIPKWKSAENVSKTPLQEWIKISVSFRKKKLRNS